MANAETLFFVCEYSRHWSQNAQLRFWHRWDMCYDSGTRPGRPRAPSKLYSKYVQAHVAILMSLAEIFIWCCHNMSSPQPHGPFFLSYFVNGPRNLTMVNQPLSRLIHHTAHNHPSRKTFHWAYRAACPLVWFSSTTVMGGPWRPLRMSWVICENQ